MPEQFGDTVDSTSLISTTATQFAALQLQLRRGQYKEAEQCCLALIKQTVLRPQVYPALFQLLYQQRRFTELLQHAAKSCALISNFVTGYLVQLQCLRQLQRHSEAITLAQEALQSNPGHGPLMLQLAILQKDIGAKADAFDCLQQLIKLHPQMCEAYWLRADLMSQPTDDDIAAMQQCVSQCPDQSGKAQLHYALARAEEYRGNYASSMAQLQLGAQAKRLTLNYNHQHELAEYHAIPQAFKKPIHVTRTHLSSSTPIFICGLPRSGTTLVEQILSSHANVTAGDELFDLAQASAYILTPVQQQQPFPQWVNTADPVQWSKLGERYLELTQRLQQTAFFTDKMPLNYKAIGIIRIALPQAKIIYCQRHPMDTLFSCYKQLFADGIAFSYDLDELADIYIAQHKLMAHWQHLYPGKIYTLSYERLVQHQRTETEQLLSYIGLPWDEHCMQFHHNRRAVFTVSNSQVRQPLFNSSIGHWQHYQKQLQPLFQRLKPYIEQYQTTLCGKN